MVSNKRYSQDKNDINPSCKYQKLSDRIRQAPTAPTNTVTALTGTVCIIAVLYINTVKVVLRL